MSHSYVGERKTTFFVNVTRQYYALYGHNNSSYFWWIHANRGQSRLFLVILSHLRCIKVISDRLRSPKVTLMILKNTKSSSFSFQFRFKNYNIWCGYNKKVNKIRFFALVLSEILSDVMAFYRRLGYEWLKIIVLRM